jgi:thymidylate synthase
MKNLIERQYLRILEDILQSGSSTNFGTLSKFGGQLKFDLNHSFPLMTTRTMEWKAIVEGLFCFLRDDKKLQRYENLGSHERKERDFELTSNFQWKHLEMKDKSWRHNYFENDSDQIQQIIEMILTNPNSRRILLLSWNPVPVSLMDLSSSLAHFYVEDNKLSCHLSQKSCEIALDVPFTIATYSLLTCIIANRCLLQRGKFIYSMGNMYIHDIHKEALTKMVQRDPFAFPTLKIVQRRHDIKDHQFEDFLLCNYMSHSNMYLNIKL